MNLSDVSFVINTAIGTVIAGFLVWAGSRLYTRFIRDRAFPTRIDNVERVVNVLLKINIVQLEAQQASLEALQGQVNGNVTNALAAIKKSRTEMNGFLTNTTAPIQGVKS